MKSIDLQYHQPALALSESFGRIARQRSASSEWLAGRPDGLSITPQKRLPEAAFGPGAPDSGPIDGQRTSLTDHLRRVMHTLFEPMRRRLSARSTIVALRELDERALRDIGLARCEIGSIAASSAAHPHWRART